jgi:hypothetical protein
MRTPFSRHDSPGIEILLEKNEYVIATTRGERVKVLLFIPLPSKNDAQQQNTIQNN